MLSDLKAIYRITSCYSKWRFFLLAGAILIQSVVQIASVLAIAPMLSALLEPDTFYKQPFIISAQEIIGFKVNIKSLSIMFISFQAIAGLTNILTEVAKNMIIGNFRSWLQVKVLHKVLYSPYEYTQEKSSGVTLKKVTTDTGYFTSIVCVSFFDLCSKVLCSTLFLIMLYVIEPRVTLFIMLIGVVYYSIIYLSLSKVRQKINRNIKLHGSKTAVTALEVIQGIKSFWIANKRGYMLDEYRTSSKKTAYYQSLQPVVSNIPRYLIDVLLILLVAFAGYSMSKDGDITTQLPLLATFALAGIKMIPLAQGVYSCINNITSNRWCIEEIKEELFAERDVEKDSCAGRLNLDKALTIKNVSFRYRGSASPTIKNLNLEISKGECIGLVGVSGSGKSTILDIMLGLLRPTKGSVLVDNNELTPSNASDWQNSIGYVGQNIFLTNDTIVNNIALGEGESADLSRINEVIKMAQLDNLVKEKAEGIHASVGDQGNKLSGGQRQRIAIARALYKNPEILFLDEATSALDADTEQRIMDTVYQLADSMTIVVIAHRRNTLRQCDRIIDIGKINQVSST